MMALLPHVGSYESLNRKRLTKHLFLWHKLKAVSGVGVGGWGGGGGGDESLDALENIF